MALRPDPTRRDFLIQLAGLGAWVSRPAGLSAERVLSPLLSAQSTLPMRTIPATGEELPIVGFGSSASVLDIPTEGTDPIRNVMRMLLEYGGRVVDTSPRTEPIDREFGQVLQLPEFQDRLFLTVKINTDGEQNGIDQMRHSQRLFDRRTFDLVQVESLRDLDLHWPNVRSWKDSGEARLVGVTVSSPRNHERLEAFMRAEPLDFVHMNYSPVESAAEERLLPLAQDLGMAVLINRPFMNGSWFGMVANRELPGWAADFDCESWAQFSVKYVLANPAVTCVLTETTNPEHMQENILAGIGPLPDEATRARMRELVQAF